MLPLYVRAIVCIMALMQETKGHGRLWEPPSRSTMWRRGFSTPINTNDNELSCGGFMNHWILYGGRCGLCGDPYQQKPRQNEAGGEYATGTISRFYKAGAVIPVTVDLTANHGGYFEFKLCPVNDPTKRVTKECLERHRLRINGAKGDGFQYLVQQHETGHIGVSLKLPAMLGCKQCVLQWKYVTATRWGCNGAGVCRKGMGPQEEFVNCADIAITGGVDLDALQESMKPPRLIKRPSFKFLDMNSLKRSFRDLLRKSFRPRLIIESRPKTNTKRTFLVGPRESLLKYLRQIAFDIAMHKFGKVGEKYVMKPRSCRAVERYSYDEELTLWCRRNCPRSHCPRKLCRCDYGISYPTVQRAVIPAVNYSPLKSKPMKLLNELDIKHDVKSEVVPVTPIKKVCRRSKIFEGNPAMDEWCATNCNFGFCPGRVCQCMEVH